MAKKVAKELVVGVFGRRMTGKSNLIESLGGQGKAAATAGAAEEVRLKLRGLGQVLLLVPAGLDDERALGVQASQARKVFERIDAAIVVIDAAQGWSDYERFLLSKLIFSDDPVIAVINKGPQEDAQDLVQKLRRFDVPAVELDLSEPANASAVAKALYTEIHWDDDRPNLLDGLVKKGDSVVLIVQHLRKSYIDRIGPIEHHLDLDAEALGVKLQVAMESDLKEFCEGLESSPDLVVADLHLYEPLQKLLSRSVRLTTIEALGARQRGELKAFVKGAEAIGRLKPGDRVLITALNDLKVQPLDAGGLEIPNLLRSWVGGDLEFSYAAGEALLSSVRNVDLVVRCDVSHHVRTDSVTDLTIAEESGVPVTNYNIAMGYVHGVLPRMLRPFVELGEIEVPEIDMNRSLPLALHEEFAGPANM